MCIATTTLGIHIGNIVGVRAKPEMSWPHAASVVTGVKHVHAMRDCTIGKFPRQTVSRHGLASPDGDDSVAMCTNSPRPLPAIPLRYLCPEAIYRLHSESTIAAVFIPAPTIPDAVAALTMTVSTQMNRLLVMGLLHQRGFTAGCSLRHAR